MVLWFTRMMPQVQALQKKTWYVSTTVISNANANVDACKKIKTLPFLAFSLTLAFAIVFHTYEPFQGKCNWKRKVRKVCTPCWNGEFSNMGTNQACFCVGRVSISFALCDPALMGQYHDIWRNPELYLQHQDHLKSIVKSTLKTRKLQDSRFDNDPLPAL